MPYHETACRRCIDEGDAMCDDSIPSEQGDAGGVARLLTKQDRCAQAARLDVVIKELHASGVLAEYRALAAFQDVRGCLHRLHANLIAAAHAAGSMEPVL